MTSYDSSEAESGSESKSSSVPSDRAEGNDGSLDQSRSVYSINWSGNAADSDSGEADAELSEDEDEAEEEESSFYQAPVASSSLERSSPHIRVPTTNAKISPRIPSPPLVPVGLQSAIVSEDEQPGEASSPEVELIREYDRSLRDSLGV